METLAKSDVFFFITSIAVVLLTLISLVLLFYIIKLVRNIQYISKKIREESDNVSEDIASIRETIKENIRESMRARESRPGFGVGLSTIITVAKALFDSKKRQAKSAKTAPKSKTKNSTTNNTTDESDNS